MSDESNRGSRDEELNRIPVRRSIAASNEIFENKIIKEEDLTWLRPGNGYQPGEENSIIGKSATKIIKKGEIILPEMIK